MTTPDPKNPKVGDTFVNDAGAVRTVTAVGQRNMLYVIGYPHDGKEYRTSLANVAKNWTPVLPPLISEDEVIHRWKSQWGVGWTSVRPLHGTTYRTVTIHPDGTWSENR